MIKITAIRVKQKVGLSSFKLALLSGLTLLLDIIPAIASGKNSGRYRPSSKAITQLIFHQGVLSPKPSKPEPLLAKAEVYS